MHIAIIVGHLRLGGAERVVSILCEQMIKRNDDVTLINLSHQDTNFFELPSEIKQINLNMERIAKNPLDTIVNLVRRIRAVRQAIQKVDPDILLSFTDRTNIIAILADLLLDYPLIISVRTPPIRNGFTLNMSVRLLYRFAKSVVNVSTGVDQMIHYIKKSKRYVIGNPVREVFQTLDLPSMDSRQEHKIISLGRLIPIKNHELLIRAFSHLASEYLDWDLHIYGDGSEHNKLTELISSFGLEDRISLHKPVNDVLPLLQSAQIYVQPSNFEGFSNAVLEAMACNLPVIVTDYAGNPRDYVQHDITGLIVPTRDEIALTNALRTLMDSPEDRQRLGKAAGYVREKFSAENVTEQWYDVIEEVMNHIEQ